MSSGAPQPNSQMMPPTVAPSSGGPLPPGGSAGYPYYAYPPPPPQRSLFWRLISWVGFGFLAFSFIMMLRGAFLLPLDGNGAVLERHFSGTTHGRHTVAIIDLTGVIMEGDGFVKKQIDRAKADKSVVAIVLRVDSPGGTVTGSDYILHHLKKLREESKLPIVVSMGSIAASGGYYVSMAVGTQEKSIYAEPTTTTGSIGVIIPHYDISQLLARFDVKDDSIASHPRKQMLSMTKALGDDDRKILQAYVMESFERFKAIVREGRPAFERDQEALNRLATGEIFTANQAKSHGLVDEIGFLEDAVDRAVELAKVDKEQVRVVRYHRPPSLFDIPGLASQTRPPGNELAALFELSAPKAYYLATSLPTLLTSRRAD